MKFSTTIVFKSIPEYYKKEISGIKNNTVRFVDTVEDKKILSLLNDIKCIRIVNTDDSTCVSFFVRTITDITRYEKNGMIIYIFTWER